MQTYALYCTVLYCTVLYIYGNRSLAHFFLELEMFQTKVIEKIKTPYFMFNNCFLKCYRI